MKPADGNSRDFYISMPTSIFTYFPFKATLIVEIVGPGWENALLRCKQINFLSAKRQKPQTQMSCLISSYTPSLLQCVSHLV